jgi:hypothetical protein
MRYEDIFLPTCNILVEERLSFYECRGSEDNSGAARPVAKTRMLAACRVGGALLLSGEIDTGAHG